MKVKGLTISSLLCVSLIGTSLFLQQGSINKIKNNQILNSGISTCFERVSQSFTSLMTKNLNSTYLSKVFLESTSDCLNEGTQLIASNEKSFTKRTSSLLNQLKSDYFWFSQKALKLKSMGELLDMSESNIVNKYASLNDLKGEFSVNTSNQISLLEKRISEYQLTLFGGFLLMSLSMGIFLFSRIRQRKFFKGIEKESKGLIQNYDQDKAIRVFQNIAAKLSLVETEKLAHLFVREKSTDLDLINEVTTLKIKEIESTQLQDSIHNNLEQFNTIIQSNSIKLDMNLTKNFHVIGHQELIDQAIFHALNYSIRFSKNETLKISTSLLGQTAVLKIKMNNHCFNPSELDYLNNDSQNEKEINLDLKLLKEITLDLEGSFEIKNKINAKKGIAASELEFLFTVAPTRKKNVSVRKGSKKEILKQIQQNSEI